MLGVYLASDRTHWLGASYRNWSIPSNDNKESESAVESAADRARFLAVIQETPEKSVTNSFQISTPLINSMHVNGNISDTVNRDCHEFLIFHNPHRSFGLSREFFNLMSY